MVEEEHRSKKAQGLQVKPDQLDNQLDLFDSRLNVIKAKKWNRDCLKTLHYGNEKKTNNRSRV